jgi:hypothetical protein
MTTTISTQTGLLAVLPQALAQDTPQQSNRARATMLPLDLLSPGLDAEAQAVAPAPLAPNDPTRVSDQSRLNVLLTPPAAPSGDGRRATPDSSSGPAQGKMIHFNEKRFNTIRDMQYVIQTVIAQSAQQESMHLKLGYDKKIAAAEAGKNAEIIDAQAKITSGVTEGLMAIGGAGVSFKGHRDVGKAIGGKSAEARLKSELNGGMAAGPGKPLTDLQSNLSKLKVENKTLMNQGDKAKATGQLVSGLGRPIGNIVEGNASIGSADERFSQHSVEALASISDKQAEKAAQEIEANKRLAEQLLQTMQSIRPTTEAFNAGTR